MTAVDRRPLVALTIGNATSARALASRRNYVTALERAGADVVVVEPGQPLPEDVDGLCLAGGPDVVPSRYGEADPDHLAEAQDPARDELEFAATADALRRDIPVLGICRGFQALNVAAGGTLTLHVTGHRPDPSDPDGVVLHHDVVAKPGSKLAEAVGTRPIAVNSRHHQAVTEAQLGDFLRPTASVDGLVEAFESTTHRWVVGVQWHPERVADHGMSPEVRGLFDAFVREAARTTAPSR